MRAFRKTSRLVSLFLCSVLLLTSPGQNAYAVVAQVVQGHVKVPSGAAVVVGGPSVIAPSRLDTVLVLPYSGVHPQPILVDASNNNPDVSVSPAVVLLEKANLPVQESAILKQAESITARPGRFFAPTSRIRVSVRRALSIFSLPREVSAPVLGESVVSPADLKPAADKTEVRSSQKAPPAPSSPQPSRFASVKRWALPILAGIVLVFGLDMGTKFLASKFLETAFHACAWRAPLLAVIIPAIAFSAYKFRASLPSTHTLWQWSAKEIRNGHFGFHRTEVSGLDDMVPQHPSLRWVTRIFDVSIAMMIGGMLGNGIDAFRLGGALDWIPLGRSLMNLADFALLPGLAFYQLAVHFFVQASQAHRSGKPIQFSTVGFLGLPLVGFSIAWIFGTAASGGELTIVMKNIGYLYLMGFSMLVGITRWLAAVILNPFVARFTAEQNKAKLQ